MSISNKNKNKTVTEVPKKKKKAKVQVFQKKKRATPESEIIQQLEEKYESIDTSAIKTFTDFPLSTKTQKALRENGYKTPTEIQLETIGLALQGRDILGAAQTGSGKTLAFIIPILERLYCKQWTHLDGVGALIITPTRELAYQIFETLRKVGKYHEFSAGLIIGGKDLKFERKRMDQCNIVVCTPGRLLQHMDENPLFDCVNMQILVLDEADRCLDMGFSQSMNAIIANLPPERQTLLFSATQTKSVKDLARLSLTHPSYVAVHEKATYSTPVELQQSYSVCNLEDKIAILWSFIRNHLKQKSIIFFSTCHQVKYVYDIFCRLRPGVSLLALYGTLHQQRRMNVYDEFCKKSAAVLFATDLVSRGLDFPKVHWVVHADCPEDADSYIHRSGRTARYHRDGESLLLLLPSELAMVEQLEAKKVPITKVDINPAKLQNPVRKMEAFLARDPEMKERAKRAFVSYGKSVFMMRNKAVFKFEALNMEAFAKSLGLAVTPRIRYVERGLAAQKKKAATATTTTKIEFKASDEEDTTVEETETKKPTPKSKNFQVPNNDSDDDDDEIFTVKRQNHDIDLPSENELELNENTARGSKKNKKPLTKVAVAKKLLKKNIKPNKKIAFDDDGNPVVEAAKEKQSALAREYENEDVGGIDIAKAREVLKEEDKFDKQLFKEKVKAKHREQKRKLKEQKKKKEEEEVDEFGGDSEGEEPDLSWLPDPDKVYGNAEESAADESVAEVPQKIEVKQKRKQKQPNLQKKKKRKIDKVSSDLSVDQAEQLALMLLQNK